MLSIVELNLVVTPLSAIHVTAEATFGRNTAFSLIHYRKTTHDQYVSGFLVCVQSDIMFSFQIPSL